MATDESLMEVPGVRSGWAQLRSGARAHYSAAGDAGSRAAGRSSRPTPAAPPRGRTPAPGRPPRTVRLGPPAGAQISDSVGATRSPPFVPTPSVDNANGLRTNAIWAKRRWKLREVLMATPGQLVKCIAEALGIPEPTVALASNIAGLVQ